MVSELEPLYREWLKVRSRKQEHPLREPEVSKKTLSTNSQKQQKKHRKSDNHTSKGNPKRTNPIFSKETALLLLESTKPYPVDLDDAIAWWNCKTKDGKPIRRDQLVRKLKANYFEDADFTVHNFVDGENREKGRFATIGISLTIECFKMMGMQVSGKRGNEIRRYFLDCEAELKRRLKEDENKKQWKLIKACVLPEPRKWEQMFPKEFWEKMQLVTGKLQPTCAWLIGLVYSYQFPKGVRKHITGKNPRNENGNRKGSVTNYCASAIWHFNTL